ncbi:MAG: hypothetical protein QOJ19_2455 [Acidimicrobiia bacterium]|nr:hypothetical protein [Acidimicrobiia bacterium]
MNATGLMSAARSRGTYGLAPDTENPALGAAMEAAAPYDEPLSLSAYAEIADTNPLSLAPRDRIALRWSDDD